MSMFEFGVDVKLCFNWSAITHENNKFCPIQYHFYFRNPLPTFCIEVPFYHCRAFMVFVCRVTGILNRKSDLPFSSFIRHHAELLPKIHVSGHWERNCSSHCPMICSTCTFVQHNINLYEFIRVVQSVNWIALASEDDAEKTLQ